MIEHSYLKPLSVSLWEVDKERITTQLKSILSLDDIEFVELRERTEELSFSMGNKGTENVITRQFPLLYKLSDSEKIPLGELYVIATKENVYHRILNKVLLILGTQTVKTFCVAFGIFYIIYSLITRHFSTISKYSQSLTLNSLDRPLKLNRKQSENTAQDELDQIVTSLNCMRLSLKKESANREKIEMELRDSRNLFQAIFQQAAVGVAKIDTKTGSFLTINQRYCEIVGYSQEEMTASKFMILIHPDDLEAVANSMNQLIKAEINRFSIEKRYFHKNGSIIWVNLNVSSMWKKGEEPDCHIAVIEDITSRKQSEEEMLQYEYVVSSSSDMLALLDKRFKYLTANQSYLDAFQLTREQLVGKTAQEVFGQEIFDTAMKPHALKCLNGQEVNYDTWLDLPGQGRYYLENRVKRTL
jgi:PAS domain S-box-containing protein